MFAQADAEEGMNGVESSVADGGDSTQEEVGETETESGGFPAPTAAPIGRASRLQGQ